MSTAVKYFTEGNYGLPIAGTPEPLPCPFCGDAESATVWLGFEGNDFYAHVECCNCGVEGPHAGTDRNDPECQLHEYVDVAREAARLWNTREVPPKSAKGGDPLGTLRMMGKSRKKGGAA